MSFSLACLALIRIGISALFVSGTHTESSGAPATVTLVPAPLVDARVHSGRFELAGEWIPPLARIPVGGGTGLTSTQLSYASGVVRYDVAAGTQLGIGESVYNQESLYHYTGVAETDRSRIVGMQFYVRQRLHMAARSSAMASLAVNPSLHGVLGVHAVYDAYGGGTISGRWLTLAEHGSQIDAILENDVRETSRVSLKYGIRYVNLTMYFPHGQLADRNEFFAPFVGLSTTLGR